MDFNHLIANQFGVISRTQALARGLTPNSIQGKLQRKEWMRVYPSVYRLGTFPASWEQSLMAAWLWAGEKAVISHRSAGALLKFEAIPPRFVDLTLPVWRRSPDAGIKVFTTGLLLPGDVARVGAFQSTSPTRTVIDLAAVLVTSQLEEVLEQALRRRMTTVPKLKRRLTELQNKGRRGVGNLGRLLDMRNPELAPTQTGFEIKAIQMLRRAGLPEPIRQFQIGEAWVDLAYPEARIAIECDSIEFHSQPKDVIKDARRGNSVVSLGWALFRITWEDLRHPAPAVARHIKEAYSSKNMRTGS